MSNSIFILILRNLILLKGAISLMSYSIVYSNDKGNTKLLADAVREALPAEECVYFGLPCEDALKADKVYVGFWTNMGTCDKVAKEFLESLTNQEVFLFGSAGYASDDYFKEIICKSKENIPESAKVVGDFMCQGKMPMSVRERYEKDLEAGKDVEKTKMLIANFDKALSHPDQEDFKQLKERL